VLDRFLRKGLSLSDDTARFRLGQPTTWGSIENLARSFTPAGIVDIGAHKGHWSTRAAKIFPGVPIFMVEAQGNLEGDLRRSGFPYALCLLGAKNQEAVAFKVDPEWPTGGSVLEEVTSFQRQTISMPMRRLDDLETGLKGPLFLKLDVQGYELEVLRGAQSTLAQTDVIVAEVALLNYNVGAPLMAEVVAFMAERGFEPYDIGDVMRRFEDRAMFQCDMIFVRHDSALRAKRKFYAHER
jgi:FkbM family methyltransferase